jgi:hypothetical protein
VFLYVADNGSRVVRKIAPDATVTTLAGTPGDRDVLTARACRQASMKSGRSPLTMTGRRWCRMRVVTGKTYPIQPASRNTP